MKIRPIERIEMPSPEEFHREYMRPLRPVVITNLFAGEPIRKLDSKEKVAEAWGAIPIPVDDEYDDAIAIEQVREILRSRRPAAARADAVPLPEDTKTLPVTRYFDLVEKSAGGQKPRIAFHPPAQIREFYRVPDVCRPAPGEGPELTTTCFVGIKGSFSHVHFDKDGAHGLLYQIYGRKRFILLPQTASHKMGALTQFGGWNIECFSEEDRAAFLEYTGGQEIILEAGDTVYLPPFCWHYADYLEDCWAMNMRFRRSPHVRDVVNALFPDVYTQAIAVKVADPEAAEGRYASILAEIAEAAARPYADGVEKVRAMRALARDIYARLHPEIRGPYAVDAEPFFPPTLPHLLDANDPRRPIYT